MPRDNLAGSKGAASRHLRRHPHGRVERASCHDARRMARHRALQASGLSPPELRHAYTCYGFTSFGGIAGRRAAGSEDRRAQALDRRAGESSGKGAIYGVNNSLDVLPLT